MTYKYKFLLIAVSIALFSCDVEQNKVEITDIKLSSTSLSIAKGNTSTLTFSIIPENATYKTVKWESLNEAVATVNNGVIQAINPGTTVITVTSINSPTIKATCQVDVTLALTSFTLSPNTSTINVSDKITLKPTFNPANATDTVITWKSGNDQIATVVKGVVTGIGPGSVTITATAGGKTATASVTVNLLLVSIAFEPNKLDLNITEKKTLSLVYNPSNATNKETTWISSAPNIASVNNGVVTGVSIGTATITATAGGKTATASVTVNLPLESITLSTTTLTLNISQEATITPTYNPPNATNTSTTWSSSPLGIVEINNGVVRGVSGGLATITATAGGKTATVSVTVIPPMPSNFVTSSCIGSTVTITWDAVTNATKYQLYNGDAVINNNISTNTYTITGLTNNTNYTFKLKACINNLCSEFATLQLQTPTFDLNGLFSGKCIPNDLSAYEQNVKNIFDEFYPANATLIFKHIKPNGTGNGSSWTNAAGNLKTIIDGITDAGVNKIYTILMAPGTYMAGSEMPMKSNVAIIGSINENYTFSNDTTKLSGNNSYRVFNVSDVDNTALIYNLNIINGYILGNQSAGGGMIISNASPRIQNVTFNKNFSYAFGGAIYNTNNSNLLLINVSFIDNKTTLDFGFGLGGAIYNYSADISIINSIFTNNKSNICGAILHTVGKINIINVTFIDNFGEAFNSDIRLINSTNTEDVTKTFVNNIFWGYTNTSTSFDISNYIISRTHYIFNSIIQDGITGLTSGIPTKTNGNYGGIKYRQFLENLTLYFGNIYNTDPVTTLDKFNNLSILKIPTTSPAVNKGLYVKRKRKGTDFYYSADNTNWFTDAGLTTSFTLIGNEIDVTAKDITGYTRTGKPDLGAYEAR